MFLACGMATPCLVAALMVMYCCFSSSVRIRMLTSGLLAAALRNNISAQALSILLLDQPSDDILAASGLEKIRFPALYTVTNEQILVFGAILNLGDLPIKRATHGPSSTPSTVTTAIIKFFVYKEQLNQSWADFVSAPVRALINLHPLLSFCNGTGCGADCKKTHADVDSSFDTVIFEVWGEHWTSAAGQKKGGHIHSPHQSA